MAPNQTTLDADTLAFRRKKYQIIARILEQTYGYPEWRQHLAPVEELVCTILSQNTSDTNRDRGYTALCERFPTWEDVRDAPLEAVIDAIRPAGLANQKAPRIQAALRYVTEQQGAITLDFLNDLPLEDAKAWLTGIHGIGPKTAAIILLFAFNRPAFPVDTHVHRVTGRLGLIGPKTTAERAHVELEAIVPPEDYYPAHLNFIRHGREICHARRPRCEICPLAAHCDYYQGQLKAAKSS
ncbi:MAG: endonuclease III [Anaerolineae bacterium]|jgi:endonuclease-3|nr:endonuclease III [Anaerolineae bacterium]